MIKPTKTKAWCEEVRVELELLWRTMRITDPMRFEWAGARARLGKNVYAKTGSQLGIPWWFVATINILENGGRFDRHLHNGDSLNARTVNVPAGRPAKGRPPYTWAESAEDALTMPGKQFDRVQDWSIAHALWLLESYNGHGYRNAIGIHSPYLWAGTCHYVRGKYIDDHVYSALAVSKQPGAAGIIAAIAPEIVPAAGGAAGRTGRP